MSTFNLDPEVKDLSTSSTTVCRISGIQLFQSFFRDIIPPDKLRVIIPQIKLSLNLQYDYRQRETMKRGLIKNG